ncbi:MAG TPA: hypothetical protein VF101_08090 [Gaiellaceae bacterium]
MAFRPQGIPSGQLVDHGSTRAGRWLRARRLRFAAWIAVVEGLLVVLHVIPWFAAVALAALALGFYIWLGRELRSDAARQASWIAAASQVLVVLVPVLVALIGGLAILAVGVLAVVALVVLFTDRG